MRRPVITRRRGARQVRAGRDRRPGGPGSPRHHGRRVRLARALVRGGVPPARPGGSAGRVAAPHPAQPDCGAVLPTLTAAGRRRQGRRVRRPVQPRRRFRLYLNATPRQGTEHLPHWAAFRLMLLRSDDAASAHEVDAAEGVKFRGGTGSCVIDDYVTRIGGHRYEEIACLVQGRTSASVIVAAAPSPMWARAPPLLFRAVAPYLVR